MSLTAPAQAGAIIAARAPWAWLGAVGMVEMALEMFSHKGIVHLDEERKAAMVSNLLVADRKSFLLRVDARVLEAVQRWANDDLRSLNAQIEYLLREELRRTGRLQRDPPAAPGDQEPPDG